MGKLTAALAWAARGFPVFPLSPGGKEPAFDGSWYDYATTDEDVIRSYWTDPVLGTENDYNIGVDCTDRIVIDLDVKSGKDGINEYIALGGKFDTLTVRTPSGGYHLYYDGPDSGNAPVSGSIDIRSHHGYVVAPGSYTDYVEGKSAAGWYEIVDARDPEWIPPLLSSYLKAPYERSVATSGNVDTPANIEAARRYLESAPSAVEGERGDDTTFKTAARCVREFALTVQTAYELMRDVYNPRCNPPWQLDELLRKVENAAEYGTAQVGALDPAFLFAGVAVPPPPSPIDLSGQAWGNMVRTGAQKPRRWLLDRVLMIGAVTTLLATGAAGKSSWGLAAAAHLAVGKDFGGYRTHHSCRVVVYNGEDDIEEQSRRLAAVCSMYGLNEDAVSANVLLLSEDNVDLRIAHLNGRSPVENEVVVKALIDLASDPLCGVLILDPLVDIHDVDESDNPQMNFVMKILKRIAKEANVAVLTMHHVAKGGQDKQETRIGNADISRGASAIINKARIAFTLLNASEHDCETYGFQPSERNQWARLDDAKMNLSLALLTPTWFRRVGVRIATGETIGVMHHTNVERNAVFIRQRIAEMFLSYMLTQGSASLTFLQAIQYARQHEPLWANLTDTEIRKRIDGVFSQGVELRGSVLSVDRSTDKPLLVLI